MALGGLIGRPIGADGIAEPPPIGIDGILVIGTEGIAEPPPIGGLDGAPPIGAEDGGIPPIGEDGIGPGGIPPIGADGIFVPGAGAGVAPGAPCNCLSTCGPPAIVVLLC